MHWALFIGRCSLGAVRWALGAGRSDRSTNGDADVQVTKNLPAVLRSHAKSDAPQDRKWR